MFVRVFWYVFAGILTIALAISSVVQPRFGASPVAHIFKAHWNDTIVARNQSVVTINFSANAPSENAFGLLAPSSYGPLEFELNGQKLVNQPAQAHQSVARYHIMVLTKIDKAALKDGTNQLSMTRSGMMKGLGLPDIYFGPWQDIQARAHHQQEIIAWVDRMTITMMVACMLLSLAMIFLSRRVLHYACLFAMFALLLGHDALFQIQNLKSFLLDIVTYVGLTFLMLSAMAIGFWTNASSYERKIVFWSWAVAMVCVATLDLLHGLNVPETVPVRIGIFAIVGAGSLPWIIYRCLKLLPTLTITGAITFAGLFAISVSYGAANLTVWGAIDSQTRLFFLTTTNMMQFLGFSSMLGTAAAFEFNSYRNALRELGQLDRIASGVVLEQDKQTQALRDQIQQVAILEERERFTRDMHDGIGGHLLSLLLKARRGDLTSEAAEHEVGSAIADLRLITAALDTGNESLFAALENFRARAQSQLATAGVELIWQSDPQLTAFQLDPRKVLEILRWAQEAITNAIRHSCGTVVRIEIEFDALAELFKLTVADNGIGLNPTSSGGRGLINMATRAQRLGGSHHMNDKSAGLGLSMTLVLSVADLA
jgi:signal transduction histidine kinase